MNKVFVDYLRNRRGASTVAAYSARARPRLPVSVPLEWMELDGLDPAAQWNIETLPGRLAAMKKDAWASPGRPQTITAAMRQKLGFKSPAA